MLLFMFVRNITVVQPLKDQPVLTLRKLLNIE